MAHSGSKLELELATATPLVDPPGDPAAEARWLFQGIGHGEDLEETRALIAVTPAVEDELRAFARLHPKEAGWVEQCLAYRRAVLAAFDGLTGPITAASPALNLSASDDPPEDLQAVRDLATMSLFWEEATATERFRLRLPIG